MSEMEGWIEKSGKDFWNKSTINGKIHENFYSHT